jgi:hypothetical protein
MAKKQRSTNMTDLIVILLSLGFGAFAWGLLVVSDWLLGEKPARVIKRSPVPTNPHMRYRSKH